MMTKEQIRADFPGCTTIIDQFRAVFGPGVKPTYFSENGKTMGKQQPFEGDNLDKHLWLAMTDSERAKSIKAPK